MDATVKLKKIELQPDEQKAKRPARFSPLSESFAGSSADYMVDACKRRKLEVIINSLEDGRVVAAIAGCVGVARSLTVAMSDG